MFKKLLVPLDGSPLAEQAVGQAVAIARASRAEIDVTLVHQPFPFDGFTDAPWKGEIRDHERRYVESIADQIVTGSSVPVTHAVVRGEAVEMICRRISDVDADLVVMTSHGRTGLSRTWLGSVADGVLRQSTIPVLRLRPIEGKTQEAPPPHLFTNILVPLDGSVASAAVLPHAAALAKCSNAHVSLLRVVESPLRVSRVAGLPFVYVPALAESPNTRRLVEEARHQLSDLAVVFHEETGVEVETHVIVESAIAPTILDFARTHGVDVIAMSTHGHGLSHFLLGSTADKVLRGSDVPMLVYRPVDVRTEAESGVTSSKARLPEELHV